MTSTNRILGSLRAVNGKGSVRMEDRFDTDIADVWAAVTDPERLERWMGTFTGDLRLGGTFHARYHASGWEGTSRVEECDPPHRLKLVSAETSESWTNEDDLHVTEVTLTADGEQTVFVLEERGMPLGAIAAYGAGIQIHVEDLGRYFAGQGRVASDERWAELEPDYTRLAAEMD